MSFRQHTCFAKLFGVRSKDDDRETFCVKGHEFQSSVLILWVANLCMSLSDIMKNKNTKNKTNLDNIDLANPRYINRICSSYSCIQAKTQEFYTKQAKL